MATQAELDAALARAEGARIAYEWMQKHPDFDRSLESQSKIKAYLDDHGLPFTDASLERAFQTLRGMGVSFKAAPVAPAEEPLPEVPAVCPVLNTYNDVIKCPKDTYNKAWFGPHQIAFRARVNAILARYGSKK
jgi:hypothetical protein